MKKILLLVSILSTLMSFAGPGDTIVVDGLNNAQLTWWGNDDEWTVFPDETVEYRRILMDVTVGCANGGCSDWDYTVKLEAFHQTGIIDSVLSDYSSFTVNGNAIDTFYYSNDTTYVTSWNVFTSSVDSNSVAQSTVYIYGDTNNYLVPTDTLYVWEANFSNNTYDANGNVTGTTNVPYDSMLIATYIERNKPFEVIDQYEMGRFMTPYGGYMASSSNGFSNGWQHTFTYDVTDFEQVLRDSVKLRVHYGGWSSGFSVTSKFKMIEGTPPRDVISIQNMYRSGPGGFRSDDPVVFENDYVPSLNIPIDANASTVKARITPSGHGFVNSQNCAEFCERDYYLKVDGTTRYTKSMWRDDCGLNPIYPQGGTWLYERANWCPGMKTITFEDEIGQYVTPGTSSDINLDLEMYSVIVPAGETPPNYIIDAQLIQYAAANFNVDAEILDIISPSMHDEHSRKNPICGKPVIEIRNSGATTLTSLTITYNVSGAASQNFNWVGSLEFLESEIIELDMLDDWNYSENKFEVVISNPNGVVDEYSDNNSMNSTFEDVVVYPNEFVLEVGTNNRPGENLWTIYNHEGVIMYENFLLSAATVYSDTISLESGCYEFVLLDNDKDGISWWANNDETNGGPITFRSAVVKSDIFTDFNADFGTEIRHQFVAGNLSSIENRLTNNINVYPNPNDGLFTLESDTRIAGETSIEIYGLLGNRVYSNSYYNFERVDIDLSNLSEGTYLLNVLTESGVETEKIIISK